jgi:hypothetical protein
MSQTIYARVPDAVKQATDAYAEAHGLTLASAVADLLDRGLQAAENERSVAALERRVSELSNNLAVLREREQGIGSAYSMLAQRTAQPVGTCPECARAITGDDLLVEGRCSACGAGLVRLIGPAADTDPEGRIDEGEFKTLLGALGIALGILYLTGRRNGGMGGG